MKVGTQAYFVLSFWKFEILIDVSQHSTFISLRGRRLRIVLAALSLSLKREYLGRKGLTTVAVYLELLV